ncbi:S8 family peptidase [Kroppenstedtia eburnea]|uniref:Subtilisin/minor extracellular protease Epr n=1 Tax=Kroppenstedtia eburnea TaxID=714067 RepID=A0A1N7KGW3_9BACL|nr:S8 family peptidase [Kroppenstedtia eburnea]EGK12011.1 peptidase families S8 and S53 subfamily [Desmospora sp. 8437]QKI82991.1 S8 family peptidase [Kroppenstedtia eburnea]SIS60724.1 subtilisin/minor extracellular protease Epr [Kroppenstedtia eburnea]
MPSKGYAHYTFLAKKRSVVDRIRQSGGRIQYISRHSGLITARIPKAEAGRILKGPDVLLSEEECRIVLPKPKVSQILTRKQYVQQTRAAGQTLTWNIQRVWGGSPLPGAGKKVRVGVIDSGIDLNHPDLVSNIKGGVNFVNPGRSPSDGNGHGTHVAGLIAARSNGIGVVGVAPSASLYAIKVLDDQGSGAVTDLIRGIDWGIDHGMHILNLSLSLSGSQVPAALTHAVQTATRKGILVITAAGNGGNAQGTGDTVEMPARLSSTIAVAALDRKNRRASFSATGPALDLAAPGVDILSTYKDDHYGVLSGTSMAAPHVTGVAALFKQSGLSADAVRRRLLGRVIHLGPRRWYGAGLVQVRS